MASLFVSFVLQLLLEWQQVSYLLFATAAPLMPPAASWLALLFWTPASTLHWVPLGCVFPYSQHGAASAAGAILSMLYPGECMHTHLAAAHPLNNTAAALPEAKTDRPLVSSAANHLFLQCGRLDVNLQACIVSSTAACVALDQRILYARH